jgi:glutamate synthase domain-containing protein 3
MSIAKGGGTIYVYDTQGSLVNTFSSAREAGKEFDTSHQTIMKYVRNGKKFRNEWILSTSKKESPASSSSSSS